MSLTSSIAAIALLDVAIIALLAAVMSIPFRLDRRPPATVQQLGSVDLLVADEAAA